MLTSHGGEIFVHTLSTARSVLEDPPAISEMAGGRVGDYRIEDLKDAILSNRLAPHLRYLIKFLFMIERYFFCSLQINDFRTKVMIRLKCIRDHMTSRPHGGGEGLKNWLILRTNSTDRMREMWMRGRGGV